MDAGLRLVMGAPKTLRQAGLSALLLAAPLGAEPLFRNVFNLDAEYALDRLMGETPWPARDRFNAAPTAFRISGGSLNIRHLLLDQRLKLRMPIVDDKFWFRFRHQRRQGLEYDNNDAELELEAAAADDVFLSLVGAAAFHKSDTAAGFAARYGAAEDRSVKVTYLWPGFDTNYAFKNTSVNEGYREAYRRLPAEARLDAHFVTDAVSFALEGRLARAWELEREEFTPPDRNVATGHDRAIYVDLRWRGAVWRAGLEGEHRRSGGTIAYDPARPAEDRFARAETSRLFLSIERGENTVWRAAAGPAALRGRQLFTGGGGVNESYSMREWLGLAEARRPFNDKFSGEAAYLADWQKRRTRFGAGEDSGGKVHQRGKLAARYDFSAHAFLRVIAAIELDQSESEKFFSFDGGTVQFQTVF